jgi:hypothetical protein
MNNTLVDLGNPINSLITTADANFKFSDYENVIIYLIGSMKKIKMSVLPREGYLPLTVVGDKAIAIKLTGAVAKTLGRGDLKFDIYFQKADEQGEVVKSLPFHITLVDNSIKSEII